LQGEEYTELGKALRDGRLDDLPVTEAERLLLAFVDTVTRHAYRVTDNQVEELRTAGWSDEQIAETVYVAGLFNLFVRLADTFDIHPPVEFELDGEVPRAVTDS
jgi:alkylhydroperoxidase family enzyme